MKKVSPIDYILCLIAKFFSVSLSLIPVRAALAIGRLFGALAYVVNYKRARVAYSNMRAAFCRVKKPSEIRRTIKRLYGNFAETIVEILRIPKINKAYIERYITIENRHYMDEAQAKGRGLIFLTGHFGNWELSSITSAFHGFPLLVLAREQKMSRLNDALNALRESKGCKVVKKGMATREIYEHLEGKGIVGILSDQDAGKRGKFVNFFGRPTSTARGAFALSRKTDAAIIPTFMVRTEGPYHKLVLESAIHVAEGESGEAKAIQAFATILEKYAAKYPEQWLWLHKRWKSTPLRKVVILSDGKAGHLNQSIAVFERIKECRREAGYGDRDTELKIIEIEYRSRFHRALLAVTSNLIATSAVFRMTFARWCLHEGCYDELEKSYADIVISCGAKTAAVNLLLSRENNAKNVMIMKPNLVAANKFNLVIMPEHDKARERENVVTTLGAPNLITPERLKCDFKSLQRAVDLEGRRNIGLFLGGENKRYAFDAPLINEILENIIGAAGELDMNILATTSRRTSDVISDILKRRLKDTALSKLLIVANERNPEWTVGGILAASDVVVVSGESSSMLSEAASSGKRVIVFRPSRKQAAKKDSKHEIFLNQLNTNGFIHVSESEKLKENIVKLIKSGERTKRLDDNKRISEAVKRLI